MKKCPYCAEMIQDEAIKCRYCHSDLTVAPPNTGSTSSAATASSSPASSAAAQPAQTSSIRYTHSGYRYVLGYGSDFFGIWDRQAPSVEAERFVRSDDGWRDAWLRFAALEPNHTTVPADGEAAGSTPHASSPTASPAESSAGSSPESTEPQPAATSMDPDDTDAVQYTHSGTRYLLGYGRTFFGIWDRQAPERPVERFPRDDPGWAAAWGRYTQMETNFSEVKLG